MSRATNMRATKDKTQRLVREAVERPVENIPPSALERAAQASNGIDALIFALSELIDRMKAAARVTKEELDEELAELAEAAG